MRAQRRDATGNALVEFAIILPLLLLLAIPVFDFARVIQANMILTGLSREGANLASRTSQDPQTIMAAIATTAPPLNMNSKGMIYITKIMGNLEKGVIRNVILQQDRWVQGAYSSPSSSVWTCGASGTAWRSDGTCNGITAANLPTASLMTGQLNDGEVIYLVEAFYDFPLLFNAMNLGFGAKTVKPNANLRARTIF